jgi:hypothetical protein
MNGRERRRAERYGSNLFIQFENPVIDEIIGRGVVVDVSKSGFAVDTETDLMLDKEYKCHLELPLTVTAKVVRQVTPGQMKRYGFRIVGLGFWDKLLLRKSLKGYLSTKKV